MAEETITILRIGTEEAVRNISDLRNNIKALKEGFVDAQGEMHKGINDLEIGTQEYKDALDELKINQNALKDAMYATTASMEDVAKSATGAGESYNSLVHRMAALKEEFRSTSDAARRADLGNEIKAINDQLKGMDALQGNFQRNVGNYANSIKDAFGDMSKHVDALRKGLGSLGGGLNGVKDGMEGISKSPFIATFGILVSLALKLGDELNLICGVEMGQATHDFDIAEKIVSDKRLDFVLASMHQLPKTEDFCFIDYSEYSIDGIYGLSRRYFEELHKLSIWGKFDVLAHLTYFMRYLKLKAGIELDISRFDELIAEIFRELAQKGKGIEINTSGIRQGYGDCFPDLKYVKMFRDMGGEIVTIGSDSHTVEDIAANAADGIAIAKAADFTRIAYFKERKPYFIEID